MQTHYAIPQEHARLYKYARPVDKEEARFRFTVVAVNGDRVVIRVTPETFPQWSRELLPTECVTWADITAVVL